MPTCDEFEIQIEQQAHGALPAASDLEAHLEGCVSCRAFAALVRQVEGQLVQRAATAETSTAWAECKRAIDGHRRGMRVLPWTLAALGLAPVSAVLSKGINAFSLVVAGCMALFFAWVFSSGWKIRRRWLEEYGGARTTPDGLLGLYRKQTAEDRRGVRQAIATLAVVAVLCPLSMALVMRPHGLVDRAALLGPPLVCVLFALYLWRWPLRRLNRMARELA